MEGTLEYACATDSMRPLVLSIHGIRTRGAWQKALTSDLNRAGFDHHPLDFGFFSALSLVWPGVRRRRLGWFLEQYTAAERDNGRVRPSIIGHSFGAYLVTRAIETYPEVCFDNVILCGSIVRQGFPWTRILDSQQVSRVLNDYGRLDFWAGVAGWVMEDAGPSGKYGFEDDAGGRVIQRSHPEFRHSDYFYSLNYEKNWIPFLQGAAPGPMSAADKRPVNWQFRTTLAVIVALLLMLLGVLSRYRSTPVQSAQNRSEAVVVPEPSPTPPTTPAPTTFHEAALKYVLDDVGMLTWESPMPTWGSGERPKDEVSEARRLIGVEGCTVKLGLVHDNVGVRNDGELVRTRDDVVFSIDMTKVTVRQSTGSAFAQSYAHFWYPIDGLTLVITSPDGFQTIQQDRRRTRWTRRAGGYDEDESKAELDAGRLKSFILYYSSESARSLALKTFQDLSMSCTQAT